MATPGDGVLPEIAVASLYQQNLVTRHTGRAVRLSIEGLVSEQGDLSLTVLDFGDVSVIDFSCADEVVAKLILRAIEADGTGQQRFFLFRGVSPHHLDPMDCALKRRGLAAAAEGPSGEPFLIGDVDPADSALWMALCEAGHAKADDLAPGLGMEPGDCGRLLDRLADRRLLRRQGPEYHSLFHEFGEAGAGEPGPRGGNGSSAGGR
jgi:hypothetical protein